MIKDDKYVKKEDSNLQGNSGMFPVHFAARYGKIAIDETKKDSAIKTVNFLFDQMENPHQPDEFGNTVLHHSVLNGDEKTRYYFQRIVSHSRNTCLIN